MDVAQLGFGVDTKPLDRANRELDKLPKSAGRAEAAAGKVTKASERMAQGVERDARMIQRSFGGLTAAVGGFVAAFASVEGARRIMGAASRSAREFETALAEVGTLLNDTSGLEAQGRALRDLTKLYGGNATAQAKAYYQAISAGAAEGAEALGLLDTANKLAVGGITSVETAVDGLTTVLNAYQGEAGSATDVSDTLFVGMRAGKTTIDELANSVSNVASIAMQSGASFEEVVAAAAALTKGGVKTTVAMNGLRAIMAAVVKPTAEASKLAQQLGLDFDAASLKSKGFAQFMQEVADKTGGSSEQLAVLFGGVEAIVPALALTGAASKDFADILASMGDRAGQTDLAFEKMAETAEFRLGVAMAKLNDELIDLGQEINARMVPAAEFLVDHFDDIVRIGGILAELIALRLTAAVVTSTAAWLAKASAMGVVSAAATGLRGALTLLGGPAGVILLTAYGLVKMSEGMDGSSRAARALKTALENLEGASDDTREKALKEAVAHRKNALAMLNEAEAAIKLHESRIRLAGNAVGVREGGADYRVGAEQARSKLIEDVAELRAQIAEANKALGDTDTIGHEVEKLLDGFAASAPEAADGVKKLGTETKKSNKALSEAAKELAAYRDEMEMLAAELDGPLAVAMLEHNRKLERLQELYFEGQIGVEEATEYLELLEKQLVKTTDEIDEQAEALQRRFDQQARDLETEIRLLGMSTEQRRLAIIALEAERLARDDTGKVIEEQRQRYEALLLTLSRAQEIEAAAAEFENIWLNAADSVGDALTTLLVDGFDKGAEAIKDAAEQLVRDLIRFFIQQRIVIPLQQQIMGGGVGGGGGSFSSMFQKPDSLFGQVAGFAAGAYGVYNAYQNGPGGIEGGLSGAASGAMAGASVGGPVGAIVGAVIGGLAGIFGGADDPDIRLGGTGSGVRKPETSFETALGSLQLGTRGGIQYEPIIDAVSQFDRAIADMLGSMEGGDEQLDAITAALAQWNVDLRGEAATVENILGSRFDTILATFDQDIQDFVMGADTFEERVQRLAEALAKPQMLDALLASLREADTLAGMTEFERQVYQINQQFDEAVRVAQELWATEAQLAEIEDLRARALARLNEAEQEALQLVEFNTEAAMDYVDAVRAIADGISELSGGSEFQRELRGIAAAYSDNVDQLNDLAQAAGLAGAREQDLAAAMDLANLQRERAIVAMEAEALALADRLGLTELGAAQAELARLSSSASSSIGGLGGAIEQMGSTARDIANAMLGDFSPLRGRDKAQFALQALSRGEASLDQVLRVGRDAFKSGDDFNQFFNQAIEIARNAGQQGGRGGGGDSGRDALQARIDELQAERDQAARFGQANELAQQIADIAGARGLDFGAVAERLGFTLDQLGAELGIGSGSELFDYLTSLQAEAYGIDDLAAIMRASDDYLLAGLRQIFLDTNPLAFDPTAIVGDDAGFGTIPGAPGPIISDPAPPREAPAITPEDIEGLRTEMEAARQLLERVVVNTDATANNTGDTADRIPQLAEAIAGEAAQIAASAPRGNRTKVAPR